MSVVLNPDPMMLALYFLAGSVLNGSVGAQQRVDGLVKRCDAAKVIQLVAEKDNRVTMTLLLPLDSRISATQNQQLACVLDGIKAMPDLSFGFLGNEEEPHGG